MNDSYRIVLADGSEIANLTMNGNNFISKTPVIEEQFVGNLSPVTVYCNQIPQVYAHMELVQITPVNGAYWFILREVTQKELEAIQVRADIDFLAMMTDIEL